LLENNQKKLVSKAKQKFTQVSKPFFIDPDYKTAFSELGLNSIDAVFSFNAGKHLAKDNLSPYRSRLQFETTSPSAPSTTLFLKRYDSPPILVQLKNWLCHRRRISCALINIEPADELATAGISTPKTISCGEQWGRFFEKRSFIITEKIPNAESLERKLPDCFNAPYSVENLKLRRNFIAQLANFIRKFHETKYRHRDLYFSHIFYDNNGKFFLIDLARAFKPLLFAVRFRIKDIAQLYYSAPAEHFSKTDRLRFYHIYKDCRKLMEKDKIFIRRVAKKARRMARHDIRHGRAVPFAGLSV